MNLLQDIITYMRRIIKSPSDSDISNNLIIDYINRFWINDVDARIQLFDLKTTYQFQTVPGVDRYNMPMYDIQISNPGQPDEGNPQDSISFYPVYQGFMGPCYINGVEVSFATQRGNFNRSYMNVVQNQSVVAKGNGTAGPYTISVPFITAPSLPINPPINSLIRGHIDMGGIVATGVNQDPPLQGTMLNLNVPVTSVFPAVYYTSIAADNSSIVVADSGQFLAADRNYGLLMQPGKAPLGNLPLGDGMGNNNAYSTTLNTVNYLSGVATVMFPQAIPAGRDINAQCYFFSSGLPRQVLFYNNVIELRSPPDRQYLVELDAYLSPAAYLNLSDPIKFAYMSEYIARGAARKIMADTGDNEGLQTNEVFFKEQEMLVWKRSQRQFTSTRTQTIYSGGSNYGNNGQGKGAIGY